MTHDIFISYSSADGEAVDYIYKYLTESAGLVCWRDKRSIKTGEDFSGVIPEGIEKSALFLVVLSPNSQNSPWVRKEIVFAHSRKKMIPLKISDLDLSSDVEFLFGNMQILTLGDDNGLVTLEEVLKRELETIPESPWYAAHAKELDQQAKEASDRKKKREREKARAAKKKESAAMVKAIQSSVRDTAKKMKENLEKDIDATTEEGARVKIRRIRNRIVGIFLVGVFLVCAFFGARAWYFTIDMEKYITVEFDGVDTIGKGQVIFDTSSFNKDYSDRIKAAREQGIEASELLSGLAYSLSESDKLENGQEVIRYFDLDRMDFRQLTGYRLKYDNSKKITVEGLTEVALYDPFSNVEFTVNGSEGYGTISYERQQSDSYWGEGDFRFSANENLKNGDVVTIEYVYDDGNPTDYLVANYGIAPNRLSDEYTVTGLTAQTKFDAFHLLEVSFEGLSGSAKLMMEKSDLPEGLEFRADKTEALSNNDQITVTLTDHYGEDPTEYCRREFGLDPVELTRVYTVSNLPAYVTEIAEISEEQLSRIKDQANDYINAYVANNWSSDALKLESTEFAKIWLLTRKTGVTDGFVNKAVFVLASTIRINSGAKSAKKTYFWDLSCTDLTLDPEGNYTPEVVGYVPSDNAISIESGVESWPFPGYENLQAMEAEYITKNRANYFAEDKSDFSEE